MIRVWVTSIFLYVMESKISCEHIFNRFFWVVKYLYPTDSIMGILHFSFNVSDWFLIFSQLYISPKKQAFCNCVLVIYLLIHKIRTAFHLTGHEEIGELFFERRKQWKAFNNPVILKQVTVVHIELEVNWG